MAQKPIKKTSYISRIMSLTLQKLNQIRKKGERRNFTKWQLLRCKGADMSSPHSVTAPFLE